MIDLVPYGNIDKKAYDRCVTSSDNFRIYATSDYLDATAQNWDALVYKDYRAVMPLPRRRKYGLSYVFMPGFIQQLGVFSPEKISTQLENDFYQKLVSKFFLVDYALHSGSQPSGRFKECVNCTLDLSRDYEDLFRGFNTNRKRVIRKGFHKLTLEQKLAPDFFLKHIDQSALGFVPDIDLSAALKRIIAQNKDVVRTWNVFHENKWVGGLIWLKDHQRITYLFPVASKMGKDLDTPTFILDSLIREHQGSDLLLDLEGSMIQGVARFYRSFGAQTEIYYFLKSRFYGLF